MHAINGKSINGKSGRIVHDKVPPMQTSEPRQEPNSRQDGDSRKEEVTATQKSVLWSKIAFFAFPALVAAVAGGMLTVVLLCYSIVTGH